MSTTPDPFSDFDFSDLESTDFDFTAAIADGTVYDTRVADRQAAEHANLQVAIAEFEALGGEFHRADGCVPFQAEGTLRGYTFYFRNRHEHWTLTVGPATDDIMDVIANGIVIASGHEDDIWTEANWSDPGTGLRFAVARLVEWLDQQP